MPSPSANPTPITPPRVALIDQRTGLIERSWYMFFLSLFRTSQDATDPQVTPDTSSLIASYDAALAALAQEAQTAPVAYTAPPVPDYIEVVQVDLRGELDALRQEVETRPISIGTVTNVALTVPTGFAVAGSPIVSDGTLAITYLNQIPVASLGLGTPGTGTLLVGNGYWADNLPGEFAFNGTGIGQYGGIHGISTVTSAIGFNNSTAALILTGTVFASAVDNAVDLGSSSYRYKNLYVLGTFSWGGYSIAAPAGATTTFLRNDGTWVSPATNYSYTGTATGMTTSPTGTIYYTRVGDVVTMNFPNIIGTSKTNY